MEAVAGLNPIINEETYLPTRSPKTVLSTKFEADLTTIETAFARFTQELDKHALFVYGRVAEEVHVETEYPKRKIQVATLQGTLGSYGRMLEQLEDDHVDIDKKYVDTKLRLQTLWAQYLLLDEKCTKVVTPLLAAQVHKDALVTCKKTIKACEELLKKKCSTKEQRKELDQIAKELAADCADQDGRSSKLKPVLQRNIRSLHEETSSFYKYASSLVAKKDLADIDTLLANIALSSPPVALDEPAANASPPVALVDPQPKDDEISRLIGEFEKLSLSEDLKFKPGVWFRSFRYGKIFSTVEEMQEYATALQGMRNAIEERIYTVCQGTRTEPKILQKEASTYRKTIKAIQKDLEAAKAKLKNGEFSTQIHAGLHYAAEHLAISEEIMHLSRVFSRLVLQEPLQVFNTLAELRALINLPDYPQGLFLFIKQLQEIKPAQKLDSFVAKISEITHKGLVHTVRQRGPSFVELLPAELAAKKPLLQKKALKAITESDDPAFLLSKLVIKQCTEFFYLHKSRANIYFSFLLHSLTTYPEYAPAHAKNMLHPAYSELFTKYVSSSPLAPYARYFDTFSEIFALLAELEAIKKLSKVDIYTFTHVRYLLEFGLEGLPEPLQELYTDAKTRFSALIDLSDTFIIPQDNALYRNLLKAIWGKDQQAALEVETSRGSDILIHIEPVIQTLLDAFLLIKIKANPEAVAPDDRRRLQSLLARYLENQDLQAALGKMHNFHFIEKLLFQELTDPVSALWPLVRKARNQELHQRWELVLTDYEEWVTREDNNIESIELFRTVTPLNKGETGYELYFMWIANQILTKTPVQGSPL